MGWGNWNGWGNMMNGGGYQYPLFFREWWPLFAIAVIWTLVWKGMALWKAARRGENVWFVVLLIVNTLGILDILYIYVFTKKTKAVSN